MKVLIIEDEINAFEYLKKTILKIDNSIQIVGQIDSIKGALSFLSEHSDLDLIFLDIQLADGLSFEIFSHLDVHTPIIFTTAFDQYAMEAFKVHSVDYLLKPIHIDDLRTALGKFHKHFEYKSNDSLKQIALLLQEKSGRKKSRCLVKRGGHFEYIDVSNILLIHSEDSLTFLYSNEGKRHVYSKTIENIVSELDDAYFFQINRSQVIHANAIHEVHPYHNQRLKVLLNVKFQKGIELIVSRGRVSLFKHWMDS